MADKNPSVLDDVSLCHLVVGVTDMDRALAFYTEKLGFRAVTDQPYDAEQRWIESRIPGAANAGRMWPAPIAQCDILRLKSGGAYETFDISFVRDSRGCLACRRGVDPDRKT